MELNDLRLFAYFFRRDQRKDIVNFFMKILKKSRKFFFRRVHYKKNTININSVALFCFNTPIVTFETMAVP